MSREITTPKGLSDVSTRFGHLGEASLERDPPLGPRESFLIAHDRIQTLAEIARRPSVVAAAVTPSGRLLDAALIEDGRALTLGRHSRCGLRLPSSRAALRQITVLARREGDAMITRAWDLDTGAPFLTEDGQQNAAVIADGPLYFSVHGYAIWLVPSAMAAAWSGGARAVWDSLPGRVFVDRRPPAEAVRGRSADSPREAPERDLNVARWYAVPRTRIDDEISHVTGVGAALVLGDPDDVEVSWGALRLEHRGRKQRHEVSAERLERGVLIGRYERCGLEIRAEPEISRVHALLVKIGVDVWAIDTASTNGVWRGGAAVEAEVLRDLDALRLGKAVSVGWVRREIPDA